jgi:hypothetical protein
VQNTESSKNGILGLKNSENRIIIVNEQGNISIYHMAVSAVRGSRTSPTAFPSLARREFSG